MADKREVVVLSAARSAVGTFGGALSGMEPADLGGLVIKEAIAVSYPRLQMFGVWWSSAEPDVLPAEMAAKGYNGITLGHSSEKGLPVHKDLVKHLYEKGKGTAVTIKLPPNP